MPQSSHFSSLSSWVLLLAKAIDSYGLDSRQLFAEAGMDHARLRDPLARFSTVSLPRLWRLAFEATSVNLAEAFDCMRRYTRMVNTAAQGVINTENTDGSYRVVIDTK